MPQHFEYQCANWKAVYKMKEEKKGIDEYLHEESLTSNS